MATPMTKEAVFRTLSMTKPFVSVAAMMLIEQGYMQLRDPVSTWLPELKDMRVLHATQQRLQHDAPRAARA